MHTRKFPILFAILILIVSQLAVFEFTSSSTVRAQELSLPSTVWSEFPSFEPKLLVNYPSAGYLTWNTSFGLYTVGKSFYWFSFQDRYGVKQVSQSVFWINTTATIDIAKITNVQVVVKNDTTFQVKYSATYKGGSLTKDTVVGNFTVTFKFYRDVKPKISVQFVKDESAWTKGGLGDFNVVWVLLPTKAYLKINETSAIDYTAYTSMVKIKETTAKENKKCEVGDSSNPMMWTGSWLSAFWDDVDGASVLYAGLDKVFGSKGITVVFPVNNGQIDPSVVGTSASAGATYFPFQRKSFYANGRFWVFYSDGSNMVYRTSTDGSTWTSATTVRVCSSGSDFSIWFDGTYLHYAYASESPIYYRRGTPNSDGTITWSAAEQTVSTLYNYALFPMVSVDSNGYVWIGYQDFDEETLNCLPFVIKSGNNDGTWGTTPSGFPYQLSTTSDYDWIVSIIPLTAGKMLAIYAYMGSTAKARRWDGSAWGSEVATTSAIFYGEYHSAVAQGDDVHLVFLKTTGHDILYVKYTYSTNSFGTETTLQAGATYTSAPVISIDPSTNDLYVFWAGYPTANHIYYRKYTASTGSWGTAVDWIAETETLTDNDRLTCFYKAYDSKIGLLYMTKTAIPYNVKFAYLSLAVADTTPPTYSNIGTNTTKAGQPCKFSVKWTDNVGLSSFIFGWNASGVWQNDTKVTLSGTTAWSNVSKVLPLADAVIGWRIWCNDTSNNWNNTGIQVLITSGAVVQPTDTAKQTATFQACIEEAVLTIQTLLASGQLVWSGEWKVSMSELTLTSGTQLYWQEHVYTYPQTTVMPSDLKLWMDTFYNFPASMSQLASLQPSGEASFTKTEIICQTESAKALQELIYTYPQTMYSTASLAYWQEHIHEYSQITFHTATITYNVEGVVAFEVTVSFTETVNQNGILQYWIEGVYVFIKKMTVNETVTYYQELHYPFSTSLSQSGTVQYWQEQAYRIDQSMRSQTALQTYGEGIVLTVQTIKPYESVLYWQEHSRSFQETSNLNTFLQSLGEGINTFMQTITAIGSTACWMELSHSYFEPIASSATPQFAGEGRFVLIQIISPAESVVYLQEQRYSYAQTLASSEVHSIAGEGEHIRTETVSSTSTLGYGGEGISLIIQTVSPTGLVSYTQEQIYTYPQTVGQREFHQVAGEGIYALSQTLKLSEQHLYGGEGQSTVIETITSAGSVKYWQEQQYVTVETAKTSSVLNVLKEIAEIFITQIDTVHLTESPFLLFEGPGGPPFVPPVPPVAPPIVPPVQPTPALPYRYVPIVAGSIIAMAVIGIVAYEKSKPPSTSSRKVAAVWSKRQTENSKKAPPKIKRENRFQTVKVKRKNRFRTVEE